MQEALIAVIVLVIGVLFGSFMKPTEAQLRPLSPDQIKVPGAAHAQESAHHH
jgi:hypothetical protein